MSYGYFQGQEALALAYYKKLLETIVDANERKELEALIKDLERIVGDNQRPVSTGNSMVQNVSYG